MTSLQERIEAAAAITGHSVEALLAHLMDVIPQALDVEVATNEHVTAVGVSASLAPDPYRAQRMKNLANAISSSDALEHSVAGRDSKVMRVERGIGPQDRPARGLAGVFSTVYHLEPRPAQDDLALVADLGIQPATVSALTARVDELGLTATTLRVTVYTGPESKNMQVELGAPAPSNLFDRLADPGEPARFLRALQPRGRALVWLGATPMEALPTRVDYLEPDVDEAIAIAGKFGDMARVGSFVAALGSRSIASITVNLGASPLGSVWLSANA